MQTKFHTKERGNWQAKVIEVKEAQYSSRSPDLQRRFGKQSGSELKGEKIFFNILCKLHGASLNSGRENLADLMPILRADFG